MHAMTWRWIRVLQASCAQLDARVESLGARAQADGQELQSRAAAKHCGHPVSLRRERDLRFCSREIWDAGLQIQKKYRSVQGYHCLPSRSTVCRVGAPFLKKGSDAATTSQRRGDDVTMTWLREGISTGMCLLLWPPRSQAVTQGVLTFAAGR